MSRSRQARNTREREDYLDALINDIEAGTSLQGWNSLLEEVKAPNEIVAAFASMRPELMKLARPRELTAEECAVLYRIIEVLIKTNYALQRHAQETAKMVSTWAAAFKQLETLGGRINHFANFRRSSEEYYEEED